MSAASSPSIAKQRNFPQPHGQGSTDASNYVRHTARQGAPSGWPTGTDCPTTTTGAVRRVCVCTVMLLLRTTSCQSCRTAAARQPLVPLAGVWYPSVVAATANAWRLSGPCMSWGEWGALGSGPQAHRAPVCVVDRTKCRSKLCDCVSCVLVGTWQHWAGAGAGVGVVPACDSATAHPNLNMVTGRSSQASTLQLQRGARRVLQTLSSLRATGLGLA